jgi:predicted DNA-binding transcriptional regulator YafY
MLEDYGYKLPPEELTPSRVASLHKSLQELQDQRDRAFTETHYNDLTRAIQSIHKALAGGAR